MKYAKIESNKVVQVQPYPEDGFVEIPDSIVCGMIKETDGTFVNPPIPQKQLDAQKVAEAKTYLSSTDWIVTKINEAQVLGKDINPLLTKYTTELQERQSARDLINQLEVV